MFNDLFQSLHESVKKRNIPDSYIINEPKDVNVIHRGYITNATVPLKYDYIAKENAASKNEGDHIYKFGSANKGGVVHIIHNLNKNQESGHETTSTINLEVNGIEKNIDLMRTIVPAVMHHIKSHSPDIIKFTKEFKFTKDLLDRLDPDGKKYTKKKTKSGTTIQLIQPIDEKSKRIISHIKRKLSINNNKEK